MSTEPGVGPKEKACGSPVSRRHPHASALRPVSVLCLKWFLALRLVFFFDFDEERQAVLHLDGHLGAVGGLGHLLI